MKPPYLLQAGRNGGDQAGLGGPSKVGLVRERLLLMLKMGGISEASIFSKFDGNHDGQIGLVPRPTNRSPCRAPAASAAAASAATASAAAAALAAASADAVSAAAASAAAASAANRLPWPHLPRPDSPSSRSQSVTLPR